MQLADSPTVTTFSFTVADVTAAIRFFREAFDAEELFRSTMPDGTIANAEFMIGDSRVMISGPCSDWKAIPVSQGKFSANLFRIALKDCDAAFEKAIELGATAIAEPQDQFWGVRNGVVRDPFGYRWSLATQIEDVSPDELHARIERLGRGQDPIGN